MRLRRKLRANAAIILVLLSAGAAVGCRAEGQIGGNFETPPPPQPPPPPDQDGDGILDPDDKCAGEKEDGKPPAPSDGCPNNDEDGDGIAVPTDKCPTEKETVNEFQDDDGCPDQKPLVQLVGTEVRINEKIQFKHNSAAIEPDSAPILDAVADVLKKHPDIQFVEVSGHASKEGDANHNKGLTQRRVESVVAALTQRGIEKQRMVAQGYGFYCLLDQGTDEKANEKNRRVEFKILQRDGKNTDVSRGCEAAEKAGVKPKALPANKPVKAEGDKAAAAKPAAKAAAATPAEKKPAPSKLGGAADPKPAPTPAPSPAPK